MADPLVWWGAITGTIGTVTGLGNLGLTAWRDRRSTKRSLRVERGWQYAYDGDGNLLDVWVYVMAWNTGRRSLHIEHAGWETLVPGDRKLAAQMGVDLPPENNVWLSRRFEIALNGETIEVVPDGPSVKIWTRLFPICTHSIDPTRTEFRPYVVTVPETYWWGSQGPLLVRPTQVHRTMDEVGSAVAELVLAEMGDADFQPPSEVPGEVVGLQRLILDGDVQRASELLDRHDSPPQ